MFRIKKDIPSEDLYSDNVPNAETLKAIESIEQGIDLVEATDVQDMFRKLDLV